MHDLLSTVFEVAGLLFLAAASGVFAANAWGLAAGLLAVALVLIAEALVLAMLEPTPAGDDA